MRLADGRWLAREPWNSAAWARWKVENLLFGSEQPEKY